MVAWIGAALGAAGTVYGIHAQKKAMEEYEDNLNKALAIYDDLLANSEKLHNQQLAGIKKGYLRAEGAVAGSEQAGLRAISAFGTQAQGAASQRLVSSGLYGSTVGAGLSRGIAADQSRQAGALYAGVSGQRAGLIAQGTNASALSIGQKIASMTSIGSAKAQLQAAIQPGFDPGIYGQLGQAAGFLDQVDWGSLFGNKTPNPGATTQLGY